jgi:putative PIN family toxin of toxin-antitoxin system
VFDTNILMSGTGWQGNPYRCLEYARAGLIEGITCKEILDELVEKLQVKLYFSDSQATDTVADLLTFLRFVTITNTLKAIPADPDDDKVLECAIVGGASYIVTGDRRHLLQLRNYRGIAIVSATEFLVFVSRSG